MEKFHKENHDCLLICVLKFFGFRLFKIRCCTTCAFDEPASHKQRNEVSQQTHVAFRAAVVRKGIYMKTQWSTWL
jgi:hypothetical protein